MLLDGVLWKACCVYLVIQAVRRDIGKRSNEERGEKGKIGNVLGKSRVIGNVTGYETGRGKHPLRRNGRTRRK